MKASKHLDYLSDFGNEDINELWENVFQGKDNYEYINRYVPFPVPGKQVLEGFLTSKNNYETWLIKRKKEKDIIGFIVHGDFWKHVPNNIGLNVGLKYSGKGYGTEALQSLIDYLKESGYKETFGLCFEENTGIRRINDKLGFEFLGRTGKRYGQYNEVKYVKRIT